MAGKLKRLAEKAGVSVATVSRILSGKGRHSAEAVRLVREAMDELGLEGSGADLAKGGCVGIALASYRNGIANDYASELLLTLMEALATEGMSVLLLPVPPSRPALPFVEEQAARHALKGILALESETLYESIPQLKALGIPAVSIGNRDGAQGLNVCAGNYQGGRDAAAYLWSLGHRRLGLLAFPERDVCIRMRCEGFVSYLAERGVAEGGVWRRHCDAGGDSSTLAAVAELKNLSGAERPTALLSTNSYTAKSLAPELRKAGFRLPEDISLISFENNGELSRLETPVTAILQPTHAMAEAAAELLLKAIRKQGRLESRVLKCGLSARATTGAPPQNAKGAAR